MYSLDFLTSPLSESDPCGPDLDLEGDGDFLNFTAFADGVLPASYFRFDRTEVDLPGQIASMKALLQRTRDLRLLVILAKYQMLDRQLEPFAITLESIAKLLSEQWGAVHPRGEDGDFALRINTVETLDDMAQVLLPLQHQPLFKSRRIGAISYRTSLLAAGKLQPRENEEAFDQGTLDQAISESDIREMVATRDLVLRVKQALGAVQIAAREGLDFQGSVSFERLVPLVGDVAGFLEQMVIRRDPSAASTKPTTTADPAEAQSDGGAAGLASQPMMVAVLPPGAIASLDEVKAALQSVGQYFAAKEPASPALLLVRQAQMLVGKSFFEAIRALLPAHSAEATLLMGANPGFTLSVERLAEVASEYPSESSEEADATSSGDDWGWDTPSEEESGDAESVRDESEPEPQSQPQAQPTAAAQTGKTFVATSRHEAFALMGSIQDYYARAEPASPIPLLMDRARHLGAMDFLSLMRLVMPSGAFRQPEE